MVTSTELRIVGDVRENVDTIMCHRVSVDAFYVILDCALGLSPVTSLSGVEHPDTIFLMQWYPMY